MNDESDRVKTVGRAFTILNALQDLDGATITEMGRYTGLANSTIHRHLSTLHDIGYVVKEGDVYQLGLRFLDHGEYVRNRKRSHRLAREKVEELATQTKERCQYVVEEHGRGIYVHVVSGQHAVETDSRVGTHLHLHSTSVGWAILAHLPEERVHEILDQWGMPALTENTITDREKLFTKLEQVREENIAYNRGGNVKGLWSVGTPVIGPDDGIVGALSISGPSNRLKGNRFTEELPNLLLGSANELELKLKY